MTRIPVWSDRSARRIAQSVRVTENLDQSRAMAGQLGQPPGATYARLWNKTGAILEPGMAVALGPPLENPATNVVAFRDLMGVETKLPAANYADFGAFALIASPIDTDTFGQGVVSGLALAQVNIVQSWHRWADIEPGQYRLHSHPAGSCRIVAKPAATGVQWCYVLLNSQGPQIWGAKTTAVIPPGGTGAARIFDDDGTQREAITVYLQWLHGGQGISPDTEIVVTWRAGWVVILAECE